MAHKAPSSRLPWWRRLLDRIEGREVVVVRGLITGGVAVGLIWGVDLTDVGERLEQTLDVLGTVLIPLGVVWQRSGVVPAKEVLATNRAGVVLAGPASTFPTGTPLD